MTRFDNNRIIQGSNVFKNIVYSSKRPMVWLRYLLLLTSTGIGLAQFGTIMYILLSPQVYNKDFLQDYLMARAVISGVNPYLPSSELGSLFLDSVLVYSSQPTPHPPAVALLSYPLGFLSFVQAAGIWLFLELALVGISLHLLMKKFGLKRPYFLLFICLSLIAWRPVFVELYLGQLMTLILILLVGTWISLDRGKDIMAGLLLGCSIAIKFIAWPILLFLLLNKKWRAVSAAIITVILINVASGLLIGFNHFFYYYSEVIRGEAIHYRSIAENISLWSTGWRLLAGSEAGWLLTTDLPPLIPAPAVAPYGSAVLPLAFLLLGVFSSRRLVSSDSAFAAMIVVSLLVSPITWGYYFVLTLIPLVLIIKCLAASSFPCWETIVLFFTCLLFNIPDHLLYTLIAKMTLTHSGPFGYDLMRIAAILISFLPIIPVFSLLWLLHQRSCQMRIIEYNPSVSLEPIQGK